MSEPAARVTVAESAAPVALADTFALLKPRVMSLVVFTGAVGLVIAPGTIHPVIAAVAVLCIAIGAGGSAAINMWYDRDIDAVMTRTRERPVPAGRVEPGAALGLGIVLSVGATALMGLAVNWVAAGLLAFTIFFYVCIYTMWLKRRTPQNIVIGGAAGAFPPMIGWAAVTGGIDLTAVALFGIIFLWTPPHFWALALVRSSDYEAANVPMLPVVAGARSTRRQIVAYTLLLLPVSLAPCVTGAAGAVYGIGALVAGVLLAAGAFRVLIDHSPAAAKRLFGASIIYLSRSLRSCSQTTRGRSRSCHEGWCRERPGQRAPAQDSQLRPWWRAACARDPVLPHHHRQDGGRVGWLPARPTPPANARAGAARRPRSSWAAWVCGMVGLAFGAVPLYKLFCQATGFGGTTQVAEEAPVEIGERVVTVRFNADTARDLPWYFKPEQREIKVRVGEMAMAVYTAQNQSDRALIGSSTFNVTPVKAGAYFNKIECFCFEEQTLAPGERADFPVSFFVDPDIVEDRRLDDVTTITLSYTFFARGEGVTEAALTDDTAGDPSPEAAGPRPGSELSYGG